MCRTRQSKRIGKMARVGVLLMAVLGLAAAEPQPDAAALARQAQQRAQSVALPQMPATSTIDMQAVERLSDIGRERGRQQFEQLKQAQALQNPQASTAGRATSPPPPPGLLVVALSSSMPEETLREYFAQLDGYREAIVVLRGFIGGAHAVKPTGAWLEKLLRHHSDCADCGHYRVNVAIDPLLYSALHIEQVPAVAWLPGITELQHCHKEQFQAKTVVYGAASVAYALDTARKGGAAIPDTLRKSFGGGR